MPCIVTKSIPGDGTVACDHAVQGHTGRHSGLLTITFRGFVLASTRLWWFDADALPARQNAIVRGTAY